MNIVYLHRTQGQGVEAVHIWGIVRALKSLGHEVTVLSPAGEAADPGDAAPASNVGSGNGRSGRLGLLARHLPELLFEVSEIAYNLVAGRQLSRRLDGAACDLVFERYAIFALAGGRYARKRGCKWILEVNYTARSPLVRARSRLLKPLAVFIERRLFRRADGLVAVSSRLRDELVEDYGIAAEKILVLTNAVDPDAFSPATEPLAAVDGRPLGDSRVIGFVGGFYPWHGLDLLVQAFHRVAEAFPDARLLLVGDGVERERIERQVAEQGLSERVIFSGRVPHDQLPAYVSAFHIGVMPDSNDYGSPMKIFEYMAMAKPVVVPDYGPLLDAVEDRRQGRVFRRRDPDSLSDCICALLADGEDYRRMARAARESIETRHNWRSNAAAILDFLEAGRARDQGRDSPPDDQSGRRDGISEYSGKPL